MNAFDLARAEAMLIGYDLRWAEDAQRYDVLGVKLEFRAPLVNPETGATSRSWQRGGELDVLLRERETLRNLLMEHKTSSEDIGPGSVYWRRTRMSGQVTGYYLGAEALGHKVEGCLYDVLGKPRLRPLQPTKTRRDPETPAEFRSRCMEAIAEEPRSYYQRGEVARLEDELTEGAFDDWQTAQQLREAERLGRHPRNPDACLQYGRMCAYFDVCTGETSIENPARFKPSAVNPELTDMGGLPVLTSSRLHAARTCQRKHRYQYLDCLRPVEDADALAFGTLVHTGLAAWWRGKGIRGAIDAMRSAVPAEVEAA